ncbi:hypothetical protein QN277_014548 [Acacia crassicarpa]|uniref:Uncharacterized protein n=1 Tax=Acacia crassicarpa TaxID=499986 RepID=A0AAE1M7R7_9FABA|nr:hypothetical protein QN277_014548 [Acacia crassicarpa]
MVSPNSINILLILICLLLRFSIGHSLQVKKSTVGTDVNLQAAEQRSVKAEMQQGVAGEMEERTRFIGSGGGRKMETATRLTSKAMRSSQSHQQGINGEASSSTTSSSKVHSIETRDDCNGGGQGCVKRKFSKRSRRFNMSGFVSWNADYAVPRPHPPRNN